MDEPLPSWNDGAAKETIVGFVERVTREEGAEPVTDDYPGEHPWAFVGGTIHRAAIDVTGTPFVDLAAEARAAFARD